MGLVSAMRAKMKGNFGIMVSAGHRGNKENGIRIIEPDGRRLDPEW